MKIEKNTKKFLKICDQQDYIPEYDCFERKNHRFMDILEVKCKDLSNISDEELSFDVLGLVKMYRTYADDLKLVGMNFPPDTTQQLTYYNRLRKRTENELYRSIIDEKVSQLEYVEQNMDDHEYYFFVYGDTKEKLVSNRQRILNSLQRFHLIGKLPLAKRCQILFRMNNQNSNVDLCNKYIHKEAVYDSDHHNLSLIESIQPQGNISFDKEERCIVCGDGYIGCLTVYSYPEIVNLFWLSKIANAGNCIAVVDFETENMAEVKDNINRSISEQSTRAGSANHATTYRDAVQREKELSELYDNIKNLGEILKNIVIRIYVPGKSFYEMEQNLASIQTTIDGEQFKAAVCVNEQFYDYQSLFLPYGEQKNLLNYRTGQPFATESFASGYPFHFAKLSDPFGSYYGQTTSSSAAVLWDLFHIDEKRLFYNFLITGLMRSGKSTLMKKILRDRASRGDFIRCFDVMAEYIDEVRALGGKTIALDGTDGIINALEVLKTESTEESSFKRHISKLITMYQFLNPDADKDELNKLTTRINNFYIDCGIINKDGTGKEENEGHITGLAHDKYPIWGDFLAYLTKELEANYEDLDSVQKQIKISELQTVSRIREQVEVLVTTYGRIFNGHTSIDNILETQIVNFNIQGLVKMESSVFDAQIFSAISLSYDNCVKVGSLMKQEYEKHLENPKEGISLEEITHFIILIDEATRFVNAKKIQAISQLCYFSREARKYFGSLGLSSQNIRDYVPQGSDSDGIEQLKTLFELTQYKFILRQDANAQQALLDTFGLGSGITSAEIADIPNFNQGECLMCISGVKSVHFNIFITEEERLMFKGGA